MDERELSPIACGASVSVANFDVLAAWKLGREQKKERGGIPPPPSFFCSSPNFRAPKASPLATETLATQAMSPKVKGVLPGLGPPSFCFCHGYALCTSCCIWLCYGWHVSYFRLCYCLLRSCPWSCITCSCYRYCPATASTAPVSATIPASTPVTYPAGTVIYVGPLVSTGGPFPFPEFAGDPASIDRRLRGYVKLGHRTILFDLGIRLSGFFVSPNSINLIWGDL